MTPFFLLSLEQEKRRHSLSLSLAVENLREVLSSSSFTAEFVWLSVLFVFFMLCLCSSSVFPRRPGVLAGWLAVVRVNVVCVCCLMCLGAFRHAGTKGFGVCNIPLVVLKEGNPCRHFVGFWKRDKRQISLFNVISPRVTSYKSIFFYFVLQVTQIPRCSKFQGVRVGWKESRSARRSRGR